MLTLKQLRSGQPQSLAAAFQRAALEHQVQQWFGAEKEACSDKELDEILSVLKKMKSAVDGKLGVIFFLRKEKYSEKEPNVYGAVVGPAGDPRLKKVVLYDPYFRRPPHGRAESMVHELSHYAADTSDYGYIRFITTNVVLYDKGDDFPEDTRFVSRLTRELLLKNADTYAGFIGEYYIK